MAPKLIRRAASATRVIITFTSGGLASDQDLPTCPGASRGSPGSPRNEGRARRSGLPLRRGGGDHPPRAAKTQRDPPDEAGGLGERLVLPALRDALTDVRVRVAGRFERGHERDVTVLPDTDAIQALQFVPAMQELEFERKLERPLRAQ